jgi:hypothetical protein
MVAEKHFNRCVGPFLLDLNRHSSIDIACVKSEGGGAAFVEQLTVHDSASPTYQLPNTVSKFTRRTLDTIFIVLEYYFAGCTIHCSNCYDTQET